MKALIKKVDFKGEKEGKFGLQYNFMVKYEVEGQGRSAYYTAKKQDQDKFVEGQECEFTEEKHTSANGNEYYIIKPIYQNRSSNFGKALKREQSKYSGFAMSYAKDLVVADKIRIEHMEVYTQKMFDLMVRLDKTLEQ